MLPLALLGMVTWVVNAPLAFVATVASTTDGGLSRIFTVVVPSAGVDCWKFAPLTVMVSPGLGSVVLIAMVSPGPAG